MTWEEAGLKSPHPDVQRELTYWASRAMTVLQLQGLKEYLEEKHRIFDVESPATSE